VLLEQITGVEEFFGRRADAIRTEGHEIGASSATIAVVLRLESEELAADMERRTLSALARTPEADTEAEKAHATAMRSAHLRPSKAAALAAADQAAAAARTRTARHLLNERSQALHSTIADFTADLVGPDPDIDRCAGHGGRDCDRTPVGGHELCRHCLQAQVADEDSATTTERTTP
jgi:hypothetical protein